MPENQTAWNSNQGIKEKNQPEQPDQEGGRPHWLTQKIRSHTVDSWGGAGCRAQGL